jgi:hypothetical protein
LRASGDGASGRQKRQLKREDHPGDDDGAHNDWCEEDKQKQPRKHGNAFRESVAVSDMD